MSNPSLVAVVDIETLAQGHDAVIGAIGVVLVLLLLLGATGLWGMHRISSLGEDFQKVFSSNKGSIPVRNDMLADMGKYGFDA